MVKPQKGNTLTETQTKQKGGIEFDIAAWEGKSREELAQALCDMIESAPREAAVDWLHRFLLPMLEEKTKKGGVQESA